ncbi:MAG: hypothetical protein AVO38_03695 [delta proteobacterium ML8_D]|nr:MAG: hypothetical protein AVO38_03695 [delta proteobacterium ML8_D]
MACGWDKVEETLVIYATKAMYSEQVGTLTYADHPFLVALIDWAWQDAPNVWCRFCGIYRQTAKSCQVSAADGIGQRRMTDL